MLERWMTLGSKRVKGLIFGEDMLNRWASECKVGAWVGGKRVLKGKHTGERCWGEKEKH